MYWLLLPTGPGTTETRPPHTCHGRTRQGGAAGEAGREAPTASPSPRDGDKLAPASGACPGAHATQRLWRLRVAPPAGAARPARLTCPRAGPAPAGVYPAPAQGWPTRSSPANPLTGSWKAKAVGASGCRVLRGLKDRRDSAASAPRRPLRSGYRRRRARPVSFIGGPARSRECRARPWEEAPGRGARGGRAR